MDIIKTINDASRFVDKKAPLVLLGSGIALGGCAVIFTGVASFETSDIVRDIRENPQKYGNNKKAIALAFAKRVIPLYIPVAIVGAGSVVCLVKSYDISTKRLAAATALAEVSIETFRLYKEQAKKVLGEEKEKEISEAVKKEKIFKPKESEELEAEPNSDVIWFVDSITNQEFLSTREAIKDAALELNLKLHSEMYVSIDEWIDILNSNSYFIRDGSYQLEHQGYFGNQNGWREGYPVYVNFIDFHTKSGHPALKIDYNVPPIMNYRERYF